MSNRPIEKKHNPIFTLKFAGHTFVLRTKTDLQPLDENF
jgi:hypothetical protein